MTDEKQRAEELHARLEELYARYEMLRAMDADVDDVVDEFMAVESEIDVILTRVEKRHGLPPIEAH